MRAARLFPTVLAISFLSSLAAYARPPVNAVATRILVSGDPYPGRLGEFVTDRGISTFSAGIPGADGIVPIIAPHGSFVDDLIPYNLNTHTFAPLAQAGILTVEGFRLDQFTVASVERIPAGQVLAAGIVRDVPSGNTSLGLLSVSPDGTARTAIAVNYPVPHHSDGVFISTLLISGSLGGISFNLNNNGVAAFQSSFRIGTTPHMGVYQWTPQTGMTRIIDSTQAVPGQPSAQWVDYVPSVADSSPFDPIQIQLADNGDTIFRGRFTISGTLHRGLYRGTQSGVSAIVDPARGDQVPGRPAGTTFHSILDDIFSNRAGDVAFDAVCKNTFERGVYIQRIGQSIAKIRDNNDPIPTVPVGTVQTFVDLKAMNENTDTVVKSTFGAGTDAREAMLLCTTDGETTLMARSDQIPGVPASTIVHFNGPTAINENRDVLAAVEFDNGTISQHLYAYLGPEQQFVRVMGQGDVIDGMELIQFLLFAPASGGGFGETFSNDREFVATVRLRPLDGDSSGVNDVWGLYHFAIAVPEPVGIVVTAAGIVILGLSRRAGRSCRYH